MTAARAACKRFGGCGARPARVTPRDARDRGRVPQIRSGRGDRLRRSTRRRSTALRSSVGIYAAGLLAYVVAATVNWGLNRAWTFRGRGAGPAHRQWATFLAANLLGFVLNRGTFVALVALVPLCAAQPVLAVAAGAGAGMFLNFALSRNYVFRAAQ